MSIIKKLRKILPWIYEEEVRLENYVELEEIEDEKRKN